MLLKEEWHLAELLVIFLGCIILHWIVAIIYKVVQNSQMKNIINILISLVSIPIITKCIIVKINDIFGGITC